MRCPRIYVAAVVAPSFSRIFFRNAINNGLPVIELAEGTDAIQAGDEVEIGFESGIVAHDAAEYRFPALPQEVLAILEDGGLIPHVKKVLDTRWRVSVDWALRAVASPHGTLARFALDQWTTPGVRLPAVVSSGRHVIQIPCNKERGSFVAEEAESSVW